jgi:asparagine N-glycosylation enzyme membrane subunit Stt3
MRLRSEKSFQIPVALGIVCFLIAGNWQPAVLMIGVFVLFEVLLLVFDLGKREDPPPPNPLKGA